jgi:hypothetical protein
MAHSDTPTVGTDTVAMADMFPHLDMAMGFTGAPATECLHPTTGTNASRILMARDFRYFAHSILRV